MGTLIVAVLLAGVVSLSVRSMIRDKRNGKSLQCGGDCRCCGGHCAAAADTHPLSGRQSAGE